MNIPDCPSTLDATARASFFLLVVGCPTKSCFHLAAVLASRCYSHGKQETDEEFDARWVTYFNKPDIDAWELRKGMFMAESETESLKLCMFSSYCRV